MLPDALGQGAGVEAVQRRHVVLLEPVSEALEAVPVGVVRRVGGHDQALDVDRRALPNDGGVGCGFGRPERVRNISTRIYIF